ncbi:MAG: porin family protein [Chryseolinea sp.]
MKYFQCLIVFSKLVLLFPLTNSPGLLHAQIAEKYKPYVKSDRVVSEWETLAGASVNNPTVLESSKPSRKTKLGPFVALGVTHRFSEKFALNVKGVYEVKGTRSKMHELDFTFNPPSDQYAKQEINLTYAEIIILPRYYPSKKVNAFFSMGPYFGYLLSEKVRNEVFLNGVSIVNSFSKLPSDKKNYRDMDFGITANIGYSKKLSKRLNSTIQVLYSRGFDSTNRPTAGTLVNSSLEICVGLSLLSKQLSPKL